MVLFSRPLRFEGATAAAILRKDTKSSRKGPAMELSYLIAGAGALALIAYLVMKAMAPKEPPAYMLVRAMMTRGVDIVTQSWPAPLTHACEA